MQLGLDTPPEASGELTIDDLAWSLYQFTVQDVYRYMGLAESGGQTLLVIVRYDPDEASSIYSDVFVPVIEALAPLR
jgi:hypothetical protein